MYELFTDRARRVMQLANQEAQRYEHEYIGTEHILLGLIKLGSGVAAQVLNNLGFDLRRIRLEVEKLILNGANAVEASSFPKTPRAKKVIEYILAEARDLNHNYVGTEHILLGIMRAEECFAAQALSNAGASIHAVRKETLRLLEKGFEGRHSALIAFRSSKPLQEIIEEQARQISQYSLQISEQTGGTNSFLAVDVGNSAIKVGLFESHDRVDVQLPQPMVTFATQVDHQTGAFDLEPFAAWCERHIHAGTQWNIATVHQRASKWLIAAITVWAQGAKVEWPIRSLTYRDLPLEICVDAPERVGLDRLLAAVAANRLRRPDRAAIIVEIGTAITVDLLRPDGAFAGGAILPGLTMSARSLKEQTDALPHVAVETLRQPPDALGKSTIAAIESGLFWGAIGAIRELVTLFSAGQGCSPDVVVSGGGSKLIAETLTGSGIRRVCHEPHLVLSGIALVGLR